MGGGEGDRALLRTLPKPIEEVICRLRPLQNNIWSSLLLIGEKNSRHLSTLLLETAGGDLYAGLPQEADPPSGDEGIGIKAANDHPSDAPRDQHTGAGGSPPLMRAGLESDIECAVGDLRLILRGNRVETIHLRMSLSAPLMIPLTDDPILPDQHRTDPGIGADSLQLCTASEIDGSPHIPLVTHHFIRENACIFATDGYPVT